MSARYNRTSVSNADQLNPGGGPGSLDGDHVFSRLNPAAGVTFSPSPSLNTYAGYSEGSRAPTSIELGCADPDAAVQAAQCARWRSATQAGRHPNAGGRRCAASTARSAGMRACSTPTNKDDILFVASTQTGFGYFKNFGSTRRQGIELGISGRRGAVTGGASYTWLDATFESPETSTGRATARTTRRPRATRDSKAPSRSSRAIAFR